jgi:hypothetical protein
MTVYNDILKLSTSQDVCRGCRHVTVVCSRCYKIALQQRICEIALPQQWGNRHANYDPKQSAVPLCLSLCPFSWRSVRRHIQAFTRSSATVARATNPTWHANDMPTYMQVLSKLKCHTGRCNARFTTPGPSIPITLMHLRGCRCSLFGFRRQLAMYTTHAILRPSWRTVEESASHRTTQLVVLGEGAGGEVLAVSRCRRLHTRQLCSIQCVHCGANGSCVDASTSETFAAFVAIC